MAKSSTAKLVERLAIVAVVVVLVAWAVLTYLGSDEEAPEAEAPQAEQGQTDADAGSDPATDAVEADEPESGDGQAAADPEAVPEQPATPETGQEETEQQQAPGAGAEPAADDAAEPAAPEAEAPQAEQGQTDVDTGSDPAADTAEADEPGSDDGQAAADPEAVPEQPATPETSQEETEQQQAPGEGAETDADETDRAGVDGEGSIAADPAAVTPEASGQDQMPGDSDGLGTGSSDEAAAQPAQEQAEPTDGEDTAELAAVETAQTDETPETGSATIPAGSSSDAASGQEGAQDTAADGAAETEEMELAMLDDGVDQQAVDEPAPDAEPAPAAITVPTFDVVRVDAFGTAVVAGKAAPGDRVDALVNSVVAATETASSRGEFVMLFELDPQSGPLEIALLATGPGGPVRSAETVVVFDPASTADEAHSADGSAADPAVLLALEDRVELLQPAIPRTQAESPASDLAIESISYGEAGDPTVVAGRGAADGQVRILVDGRPVMTEQVSETGAWSADLEVPDAATHALRVEELDEAGNVVASVATPFERTLEDSASLERNGSQDAARSGISELDGSVSVEIVTVEPGFTLWGISRKYYGKGRLYVRIYHSNLQQIEDPDLIFPGQQFVVPALETAPQRRPD